MVMNLDQQTIKNLVHYIDTQKDQKAFLIICHSDEFDNIAKQIWRIENSRLICLKNDPVAIKAEALMAPLMILPLFYRSFPRSLLPSSHNLNVRTKYLMPFLEKKI